MLKFSLYTGQVSDDMKIKNVKAAQRNNEVELFWEWPKDTSWNRCVIVSGGISQTITEDVLAKSPGVLAGAYAPSYRTYIGNTDTCFVICPAKLVGDTMTVIGIKDSNVSEVFRHHVDISCNISYDTKLFNKFTSVKLSISSSEPLRNEVFYYYCIGSGAQSYLFPICMRNTDHVCATFKVKKKNKVAIKLSDEQKKYITLRQGEAK